jgi:hypothetical protein
MLGRKTSTRDELDHAKGAVAADTDLAPALEEFDVHFLAACPPCLIASSSTGCAW